MIKPLNTKIGDLLNNGNAKLTVPNYQRSYNWGIEQINDMINDIKESVINERELFLGNFIFDVSRKDEYMIVDGQQRITTISIILCAVRDIAKEKNLSSLSDTMQKTLSFTNYVGEVNGAKLNVSDSIKDLYEYMVSQDWEMKFPTFLNGKGIKRQANKIQPIYKTITEYLLPLSELELKNFVNSLLKSYVIVLEFEKQEDVYDIFERTNARGLDLNIDDLLKNHLFSKNLEGIDDRRDSIILKANGTLPRLLKYFWISKKGHIRSKELYNNLRDYSNSVGADVFLTEMEKFAEFYFAVNSDSKDVIYKWLEQFGLMEIYGNDDYRDAVCRVFFALKLFNVKQTIPLIYSIFYSYRTNGIKNFEKLIGILSSLEKYHFINNIIANRVGNDVEKLYANQSEEIYKTPNRVQSIDKLQQELRNKKASRAEFISLFEQLSYTDNYLTIIYIYDRMQNYKLKGAQKYEIYNPDVNLVKRNFNIEHIYSQSYKNQLSVDEQEKINLIGNLLVISRHTNSTLQNKPVSEKFEIFSKPEQLHLKYVAEFIEDYNEKKDVWDVSTIEERSKQLAEFAYDKFWNF